MKNQIIRYLLAMNATAFDSAIHALVLFCGVAGTHQVMDSVPALNVQQLVTLFFIAFGRALLAYLDAHPISDFYKNTGGGSPATPGTGAEPTAAPAHSPNDKLAPFLPSNPPIQSSTNPLP